MRFFAIDDELDDASKDAHEEQETMEAQEAQNHQLFQSALSMQVAGNEADAVAAYLQLLAQPLIEQADAEAAEIKSRPSLHLRFLALKNLSELEEAAGKLSSALQRLLGAVRIEQHDAVLWQRLGQLASRTGQRHLARLGSVRAAVVVPPT